MSKATGEDFEMAARAFKVAGVAVYVPVMEAFADILATERDSGSAAKEELANLKEVLALLGTAQSTAVTFLKKEALGGEGGPMTCGHHLH